MSRCIPVEEEQDGEQGLVNVSIADALVEQVARVAHHRLQRVLPHDDVVELVCVEVLEEQLVAELPEVVGEGGAAQAAQAPAPGALRQVTVGQVHAAAAAVQADG